MPPFIMNVHGGLGPSRQKTQNADPWQAVLTPTSAQALLLPQRTYNSNYVWLKQSAVATRKNLEFGHDTS